MARILLTGGSASGKSTFGGKLALQLPAPRFLVDTARPDPDDPARPLWRARMAGSGFTVLERPRDVAGLRLPARGTVLVECLCHLCANEMFDDDGGERDPVPSVLGGIEALGECAEDIIVVTNEIGSGLGDYAVSTLRYIEALGRINCALAERFDGLCELVCGIPVWRKGARP